MASAMARPPRSSPGARSLAIIWSTPPSSCPLTRLGHLARHPRIEFLLWKDVHGLAHRGVSQAAQLRAHDGIGAQAVGGDAVLGGDARHGVDLLAELRDPEV